MNKFDTIFESKFKKYNVPFIIKRNLSMFSAIGGVMGLTGAASTIAKNTMSNKGLFVVGSTLISGALLGIFGAIAGAISAFRSKDPEIMLRDTEKAITMLKKDMESISDWPDAMEHYRHQLKLLEQQANLLRELLKLTDKLETTQKEIVALKVKFKSEKDFKKKAKMKTEVKKKIKKLSTIKLQWDSQASKHDNFNYRNIDL